MVILVIEKLDSWDPKVSAGARHGGQVQGMQGTRHGGQVMDMGVKKRKQFAGMQGMQGMTDMAVKKQKKRVGLARRGMQAIRPGSSAGWDAGWPAGAARKPKDSSRPESPETDDHLRAESAGWWGAQGGGRNVFVRDSARGEANVSDARGRDVNSRFPAWFNRG